MLYDVEQINNVIRFLKKHGHVQAVAILAMLEDGRVIGGLRQIARTKIVKGYMPLPAP